MNAILAACLEGNKLGLNGNLHQPDKNPSLTKAIRAARLAGVPDNYIHRTLQLARQGITEIEFEEFDTNWEGEAYTSVSGQNSNNSIRVSDGFMKATEKNTDWNLIRRTDGEIADSVNSKELWDQIGYAAWCCADPGLQFDTTINDWHTCAADGRINGSNPCSEYMFLDDTACNLASMNLMKFLDIEKNHFQIEDYRHVIRLLTVVLEISVLMAQFPSPEIAKRSYEYRTLGLGYANLGTLLMVLGIPYDSPEAEAWCGALHFHYDGVLVRHQRRVGRRTGRFRKISRQPRAHVESSEKPPSRSLFGA